MRSRGFASVLLISAASLLVACGAPENQQQGEMPAPQVEVVVPVSATVADWNGYTGRFETVERSDVRARVSGYVKAVHFEDGARVKAGDLLFTLDDRPFRASLAMAEAQLAQAQAQLVQAQSDVERSEKLRQSGAVSMEELEQNRTRLASAEAAVASAQAGVEAARLDLSFTRVTAPIDGRVSARNVDAGNLIAGGNSAGDILTTIVRDEELYFTFNVSESDYLRYSRAEQSEGAVSAEARLQDETAFTRSGTVVFADNQMGATTGSIRIRARIENTDGLIRPGMTGEIRVNGSAPYQALLVPPTAVQTDGARRTLFLVNEKNEVEARPVELGPMSGNLQVIANGIQRDDRVITNGLLRVQPGMVVNPVAVQLEYASAAEDTGKVQSRPAMTARRVN